MCIYIATNPFTAFLIIFLRFGWMQTSLETCPPRMWPLTLRWLYTIHNACLQCSADADKQFAAAPSWTRKSAAAGIGFDHLILIVLAVSAAEWVFGYAYLRFRKALMHLFLQREGALRARMLVPKYSGTVSQGGTTINHRDAPSARRAEAIMMYSAKLSTLNKRGGYFAFFPTYQHITHLILLPIDGNFLDYISEWTSPERWGKKWYITSCLFCSAGLELKMVELADGALLRRKTTSAWISIFGILVAALCWRIGS